LDKTPLRLVNTHKLVAAFEDQGILIDAARLDPLSKFNEKHARINYMKQVLNVMWKGHSMAVPLDFYWREVADWEIQDLVTIWMLTVD